MKPSDSLVSLRQSYLETLRERLELFLLLLPPESRIPLTFASCSSWPNTDVWDNELAVSMDEIMQQYPSSVASFNFAHFGCNGVTNAGCAATFSIALADLVGKSPPAPDLVASSFLELWDSHFMDAYELVMRRMRRISCEHSVILAALELATGLFNAVLQTIAGLISSEDMRTLSFPAAEFVDDVRLGALPPVGWNSTAVLGPKRERIANFNLPSVKSILRNVSPERPAQSLLFAYAMSVRESFIEPELGENTGNIFAAEVVGLLGRGDTSDVPFADFMSCIVRYCCLALDSALEEIAVDKFAACVCLRGALEKEKMRYRTRVIEDAATWGDTHLPTSWQSKLLKPTIHSRVGTVPLGRKRAGSFGDGPNAVVKRPRAESSVASYADLFERIAKASSEIEQSLKIV